MQIAAETKSWLDFDGGFAHEDHLPSCCRLSGLLVISSAQRRHRWDHDKLLDPCLIQQFQAAVSSLPVPHWKVPIDEHVRFTETQLLILAKKFFTRDQARPRPRPALRESTLSLIALKRQALDLMRNATDEAKPDYIAQVKEIEAQLRPLVRNDQQKWYDDWTAQLDEAGMLHDHKRMFGMLQRLGRRKKSHATGPRPLPRLLHPDGRVATSVQECQSIWQDQFAQIEGGRKVSPDELAGLHAESQVDPSIDFDMAMVPTLWELHAALQKIKPGKAPGPNGLLPEVLRAGGLPFCFQLAAITAKSSLHCREALAWKGGRLIPLFKGKGSPQLPSNHRAIFVSNISTKLYHSALRTRLESIWASKIDSLQQGGRKGFGTDLSHHLVQSFFAWGRRNAKATAMLFVDLQAAFYSVFRGSLFNGEYDETHLRSALQHFGILPRILLRSLVLPKMTLPLRVLVLTAKASCSTSLRVLSFAWFSLSSSLPLTEELVLETPSETSFLTWSFRSSFVKFARRSKQLLPWSGLAFPSDRPPLTQFLLHLRMDSLSLHLLTILRVEFTSLTHTCFCQC